MTGNRQGILGFFFLQASGCGPSKSGPLVSKVCGVCLKLFNHFLGWRCELVLFH